MQSSRIQLAEGGLSLSRIVAGMWRMAEWSMTPTERAELINQCLELGVTTFDHADIYGDYAVETLFGEGLQLIPSIRESIEIVTKCGIKLVSDKKPSHSLKHYDTSAAHIRASVENSLKVLGTDYIDVLLIHRPDPLMHYDEIAETFSKLAAQGKVKHFGVSNFTATQLNALHKRYPLVTNQIELSPLQLSPMDDGMLDLLQDLAIPPMLWSALGGGRIFNPVFLQSEAGITLKGIAEEWNVSLTTLVYAWLLKLPSHPLILTGSGRIEAIEEAVQACDLLLDRITWFKILEAVRGFEVA